MSVVANRSHVVGLLEGTVRRALATCEAGAYLHWWVMCLRCLRPWAGCDVLMVDRSGLLQRVVP